MIFQKVGIGIAQNDNGVRVSQRGRNDVLIKFPTGEMYIIGIDQDDDNIWLLSGEVSQMDNKENKVRINMTDTKVRLLETARAGMATLTKRNVEIAY